MQRRLAQISLGDLCRMIEKKMKEFLPSHWLELAVEAEDAAARITDASAKRSMELIALGYRKIAQTHTALAKLPIPMEKETAG